MKSVDALLLLLRAALGAPVSCDELREVQWEEVYRLAAEQGVVGIAADGYERLSVMGYSPSFDNNSKELVACGYGLSKSDMPEDLYYSWLGQVMVQEEMYGRYKKAIADLAKFYERQGIKMLLLKGYELSLDYPEPAHRPCGDIDVWLFNENDDENENAKAVNSGGSSGNGLPAWRKGDEAVERELGIKVDSCHEHHTTFLFEGFTVENHYDIINTKETRTSKSIDAKLKELLLNEHKSHELNKSSIYLPSATFNAVFLIRHLGQHMAGEKVVLRHLLDWCLFLNSHSSEVDWDFVQLYWKKIGIDRFAKAINTVCKKYLKFDEKIFHGALIDEDDPLADRLMNDILSPEFKVEPPQGGLQTSIWKIRRFFANGWKRRLVYKESLIESFVTGSISKVVRNDYR